MEMQSVKSSNLTAVGYDGNTRTLFVQFNSGKIYKYEGVTPEEFAAFGQAESKGRYFANAIKRKYTGTEYIPPEEEARIKAADEADLVPALEASIEAAKS